MTRARLAEVASLARRRERARAGQFLVEGVRSVEAAVAAGAPLVEALVTEEMHGTARVAALIAALDARGIPVHTVSAKALGRVSDAQTAQGAVAVARRVVRDLDAEPAALDGVRRVVVLDGVQDPGNVGALVRTAAWFGVEAILAGPDSADFEGPKAVRAAMGGLWDVRLVRTADLPAALDTLGAAGLTRVGADLDGPVLGPGAIPPAAALVLGSEAHGISDAVRARLDARVRIAGPGAGAGRAAWSRSTSPSPPASSSTPGPPKAEVG